MIDNRQWLQQFLQKAPYIDPYDDEEYLVDALMPYVDFIRAAHERSLVDKGDAHVGME